jgi:hypothetical protein
MRPSSGAACSDVPGTLKGSETPLLADVAAPEDERIPMVRQGTASFLPLAVEWFARQGGFVVT